MNSLRLFLFHSRKSIRMASESLSASLSSLSLSNEEVSRYGRQLILNEIGRDGQLLLKSKSVLIVGCGGLGCPSSLYLAAAGIGKLGLMDNDLVERSNLHRQVLHTEGRIGMEKSKSAIETLKALNSNVQYEAIDERLNRHNAIDIINKFDIIVDATDNAMTRYLLSDACVINKKPLVSGSALKFDGQLTVYNYDSVTPCYRCLFPNPPPPGTVTNCSDGGVMGVIPGIIGSVQALETIKIAVGIKPSYAGQMLLFDGREGTFKTVKIRGKKDDCVSCGQNPTIGPELIDYEEFCGVKCGDSNAVKLLTPEERITGNEYKQQYLDSNVSHILIDVRPKLHADITKLPNAINIPLNQIVNGNGLEKIEEMIEKEMEKNGSVKIFTMCRRGNASQKAAKFLKDKISDGNVEIKDIVGGLEMWSKVTDTDFPMY